MLGVWQKLHWLFTASRELEPQSPVAPGLRVVALIVNEEDRSVLEGISSHEAWDIHFVESHNQAHAVAEQLAAPVILFDRHVRSNVIQYVILRKELTADLIVA